MFLLQNIHRDQTDDQRKNRDCCKPICFRRKRHSNTIDVHTNKEVTFANLGDKSPADGFDTEPVARPLTLGNGNNAAPKAAPKTQTTSAPAKTGLDIDALLG